MIPTHSSGRYLSTRDLRHAVKVKVGRTVTDLGFCNEQQAIILISRFSKAFKVLGSALSLNDIAKSLMNFEQDCMSSEHFGHLVWR